MIKIHCSEAAEMKVRYGADRRPASQREQSFKFVTPVSQNAMYLASSEQGQIGERMLSELNHLTLAIRDLERSFDFYVKVLGFRPRAQWSSGAYLSLGNLWLCLSVDGSRTQGSLTDYTHYAFTIKQGEFSEFVEKAHRHGVVEWKVNRSEGDSFYFLDPDGHKLEAHVGSLETRLAQCWAHPYAEMKFFD